MDRKVGDSVEALRRRKAEKKVGKDSSRKKPKVPFMIETGPISK